MFKLDNSECLFSTTYDGHLVLLATAVFLSCGHLISHSEKSATAAIEYLAATNRSCLPAYIATTKGWRSFKHSKHNQSVISAATLPAHVQAVAAMVIAEAGGTEGLRRIIQEIQHDTVEVIRQQLFDSELQPGEAGQGPNEVPGSPDGVDAFKAAIQGLFGDDAEVFTIKLGPDGMEYEGGDLPPDVRTVIEALQRS